MSRILVEKNVAATMRDGTVLRADVYRPAGEGRFPVLIQRTPYNKELLALTGMTLDPIRAAAAGYVVVIQDVRARWASDGGVFWFYRNEAEDGHDTALWAAQQPWCSGEVGAYGVSYMGGTSWLTAATAPAGLRAISATTAPNDFWRDHLWSGGALGWGVLVMWTLQAIGPAALLRAKKGQPDLWPSFLQLVDDIDAYETCVRQLPLKSFAAARPEAADFVPFFFETLKHPAPDHWTGSLLMTDDRHRKVRVPALIIAGWHDLLLSADLQHFAAMKSVAATAEAQRGTRIVIGPWTHGMFLNTVGDLDFGMRASGQFLDLKEDLTALQLRWFDRWLKNEKNGMDEEAPVRIFVQGLNRWRDEKEWPLARAQATPLYLRATGGLNFSAPGDEPPDSYIYDPNDPCPTCGGSLLMPAIYRRGPVDQAPILSRRDVLCYTTEPLTQDMEVTGPVQAQIYAATSAKDTDWMIKLCDVHPDGRTFNLCDGVLRASYRASQTQRQLVEPDAVLRYEIEMSATSMLFREGHRLRVLITSSDFPRYDRNPNTGELGIEATVLRAATQKIFHDAQRASHLVLPVIPHPRANARRPLPEGEAKNQSPLPPGEGQG